MNTDDTPAEEIDTPATPIAESVEELTGKITELEAGWKRTMADFDNYRKRIESERSTVVQFAATDAILSLLPVLDNFHRATQHAPKDGSKELKNWIAGVRATEKQFEDVLRQRGVERIEVKVGDPFKPNCHEAIGTEQSKDIAVDHISSIVEDGYSLHGKVLRPTKVKVKKAA